MRHIINVFRKKKEERKPVAIIVYSLHLLWTLIVFAVLIMLMILLLLTCYCLFSFSYLA